MKKYFYFLSIMFFVFLSFLVVNTANAITQGDIIISEVFPKPSSGIEWVELYNTTDSPVVLDGLSVKEATSPNAPSLLEAWQMPITMDNFTGSPQPLIGQADGATDGIDASLGETELPPALFSSVRDMRFLMSNNTPITFDLRKTDDSNTDLTFTLAFQAGDTGYPLLFTWDSSLLPADITGTVEDGFSGAVLPSVDISTGSFMVPETASNLSSIKFVIHRNIDTAERHLKYNTFRTLSGELAAGAYTVVEKTGISLNDAGDSVRLVDTDIGTIIDQVTYGNANDGDTSDNAPAPAQDNSIGRTNATNSGNNSVDFSELSPTKGVSNVLLDTTAPDVPVITTTTQIVNTDTIQIIGTAEADTTIVITGGATTATGVATVGVYDIIVTLTHNTVNNLSVTATDSSSNTSSASTVSITHSSVSLLEAWDLSIETEGFTGVASIGQADGATDGIDASLNEAELPPVPPDGLDMRLLLSDGTAVTRDLRSTNATNTDMTFIIELRAGDTEYPITFTWDPSVLPTDIGGTVHDASNSSPFSVNLSTGSVTVPSGNTQIIFNVHRNTTPAPSDTTAPDAPTSFVVGSPTLTTLALSWTNNESDEGSYYTIKRSTSVITEDNFATATTLGGAPILVSGTQGYLAKNLSSGTTYYFAIRTTDAVGNSSVMSVANGITASDVAPAPIDSVAPAAVDDLSLSAGTTPTSKIVLSWSATGDDDASGIATKYIIKRSTTVITANTFDAAITVFNSLSPKSNGSTETLTVSGLLPGTTYHFAVKVIDEAGNISVMSNNISLATSSNLPAVTSVSPTTGQNDDMVSITIIGANFVSGSTTVRLTNTANTINLDGVYVDATHITATIPVGAPAGVYGIRVIDVGGISTVLASAYTITNAPIPFPSVTNVVPSTLGTNDSDVSVTIYGTGFAGATGATLDTGTPIALTNFIVVSDTKITATIPETLSVGVYNVKVTNVSGTNAVSVVKITVNAPVVISSGTTQDQVTDKPINMSGTNTIPVQITLNSNTDNSTVDNNTIIAVVIPPETKLTNSDGSDYVGNINPPQLVKPTAEIAAEAGEGAVVITMGNPNQTIKFDNDFVMTVTLETTQSTAPLIWYYNPSGGLEIAGKDGTKDGVTYAPGGTVLNTILNGTMYTYTIGLLLDHMSSYVAGVTPTISGISGTSGEVGTTMTITGTNFGPGATVKFNTTSASVVINSTTQITATVPSSLNAGSHTISVTNADALSVTSGTNFTVTVDSGNGGGGGGGGGGGSMYALLVANSIVGQVLGASIGPIDGCDNRTTGFSITTGQSCVENFVTGSVDGKVLGAESFHFTLFMKKNSKGNEVMELQKILNDKLDVGLVIDGKFGPKTNAAVVKFQIANKLVGDGIVGPLTRAVLNK